LKIIIQPKSRISFVDFKELYKHKDLLYFMLSKEIKVMYKQTILGFSWAIIRPVFSMIIFSFIFGNLAQIPSDGIPYSIFSYAALVPWTYFSSSLTKSAGSLIQSINVLTKIYFPRIYIPLAPVLAGLLDFLISLSVLFLMMIYFKINLSFNILFLPILILIAVVTSFGLGLWLSALAIQYRDIRHAVQYLTQLMMYAAPVVWPFSMMSEKYGETFALYYSIYPMVGVIEGFRSCLLNTNAIPWESIVIGGFSGFLICMSGLLYFNSKEYAFSDVA
jgi:lipopolysaccharide transport system permease protein